MEKILNEDAGSVSDCAAQPAAAAEKKSCCGGTDAFHEVLDANSKYSKDFGCRKNLPMPPARHFAIITCMDARLDPAKFAGLDEGDAHVIRNAGGRVSDDVIRSLMVSHKMLGTQEWFIIHHTDCGMLTFTDDVIRGLLAESLESAAIGPDGWYNPVKEGGSEAAQYINFLTFEDVEKSVVDDVRRLREHPLVPASIAIYGFVYDDETGALTEVPEAMEIGKPR